MMAEELKAAIQTKLNAGATVASIAREAGIPQPVLHRFVRGTRSLTLETASKLAETLGLVLKGKQQ